MKKILSIICTVVVLSSPQYAQKATLLENFSLIDGAGNPLQKNKSMLIVADTIHSIFDYGDTIPLEDYRSINLTEKFLLPGLFDSHTHISTAPSGRNTLETAKRELAIMLENGITGIRDMAGDARQLSYLKRQALLDEIKSPDIYYSALLAGPRFFLRDRRSQTASLGLVSGKTPWMREITSETDIRIIIAEAKGAGATGIKLYSSIHPELFTHIVEESHAQNLLVWSHAAILPSLPSQVVDAGVDGLSHSALLAAEQLVRPSMNNQRPQIDTVLTTTNKLRKLAEKMAQKKIHLDPTVLAFRNMEPGSVYKNAIQTTRIAYEAGVPLVVGTDLGFDLENPGTLPLIEEMIILVNEVNITPLYVIQASTKNAAELLGIEHTVGTIKKGKKANLLIVEQNPLTDIKNLEKVYMVFKNGKTIE